MATRQEFSISVRLLWPFARISGATESVLEKMAGISAEFADPDTRVPRSLAIKMLEEEAARQPTVGLHAASLMEPQDFDVLEYAARSAPTLGDAAHCLIRYFQLMDDAAQMSLETDGDRAIWRYRLRPGVSQPPAANDFTVATALEFARRNTAMYEPPIEIWLAHDEPSYAAEYEKVLGAPVRFGAPCNGAVVDRARLASPMFRANPSIFDAFERHANALLDKLRKKEGLSGSVRRELLYQLRRGPITMDSIARSQAMAIATLRRRLQEEGTTFAALLEEVRRDLAVEYLRERSVTLTEIAFLLGYGNVTSFTRAFQRWTGVSPATYREESERPLSGAPAETSAAAGSNGHGTARH